MGDEPPGMRASLPNLEHVLLIDGEAEGTLQLHDLLSVASDDFEHGGVVGEVVDLRALRPLDSATIIASVMRTHRAVIVDEGWRSGSISAEVAARIGEAAFYDLDAPIGRVCSAEVPMPYPKHLEEAALPQVDRIVAAALQTMG